VEAATREAALLLGREIGIPEDAAVLTWERAAPRSHSVDGMHRLGESVSGTGIAAVVAQADAVRVEQPESHSEPQG
jgi:hypothetical protein